MLKVGYLSLPSPVAVTATVSAMEIPNAGLVILSGLCSSQMTADGLERAVKEKRISNAIGISTSSTSINELKEAAMAARYNRYLMELDLTDYDDVNLDVLIPVLGTLKQSGATISMRVLASAIAPEDVLGLRKAGLDLLHLDMTGQDGNAPGIVKKMHDLGAPQIMAQDDIGDFDEAAALLTMGASTICLNGNSQPDFVEWLTSAMQEWQNRTGWYNAPKHICSGGDLRGLAFCCPPVKSCPVHGALKKLGIGPKEFVRRKLELGRGTLLEKGDGTCFGSLVWCCKSSKPCYLRDAALRQNGLSDQQYMELKSRLAQRLLDEV
ncbi:MAG: hypothetical protein A4E45_01223 [Methanosaeta sp. PtaB.Bin039]|nr:MAG: hypothetical protein A4E45_01223 [Methanosaeta sp. PtaB.Bin039]OPY46762.1 MAG: hypothetical protein A4E47_00479 [Methanosaeta sp. PtaU1.Bin028]HOT07112.1 methanogenesis marker 9 domain-containing protein [Methanotrichaceae archaeon]HQF17056.1 methanogenesis marker 9 domain-containing protein [Methanotrichaceae archaeon]HQI91677.1 methanogenesis marker 9 domain-containing protein [Methanotrichaceae archaeon]